MPFLAKILKEKNPKLITLFGGPHPTFYPGIINEPEVDAICRGEGEYAMLDLADSIDRKENFSMIANLWVKGVDGVTRNGSAAADFRFRQNAFSG